MWTLALLGCHPDPAGRPAPDPSARPGHAGARPIQRLNRVELDHALRELTGLDRDFAAGFPPDELAWGFDNQAEALVVTTAHLDALERVTDDLAAELLVDGHESTRTTAIQGEGPGVSYAGDGQEVADGYVLVDGSVSATVTVVDDGAYELLVFVAGEGGAELELTLDGEAVLEGEVDSRGWTRLSTTFPLAIGPHVLTARIANPGVGRRLGVDQFVLTGPTDPEVGRSALWRRWVTCAPQGDPDAACAERVLRDLGERAWRRPLDDADLRWLFRLEDAAFDAGAPADEALVTAIRGVLLAPEFLYRPEAPPAADAADRPLDGYELATRLAAFLWSSIPDDELLAAARAGDLDHPDGIALQVRRMRADPRAAALVEDLGGQWFDLRDVPLTSPDPTVFPAFDDALRASMEEELRRMSAAFFLGDRDLRWLVTTDESFVDARLAEHYRVGGVAPADGFVLTGTGRAGITGTAAFLTVHARPTRASAVSRGKWVLENLLCDAPPPPPPSVDQSLQLDAPSGSVREQEEAIRSSAACQACHASMDAVGFSLHGFDGTGEVRAEDELGWPIDDAVVWDGRALVGGVELAGLVADDPRLPRCAARQTLTWALGRPLDPDDDPVLDDVTARFVAGGSTFDALALAVATSAPFRRRGHVGGAE